MGFGGGGEIKSKFCSGVRGRVACKEWEKSKRLMKSKVICEKLKGSM